MKRIGSLLVAALWLLLAGFLLVILIKSLSQGDISVGGFFKNLNTNVKVSTNVKTDTGAVKSSRVAFTKGLAGVKPPLASEAAFDALGVTEICSELSSETLIIEETNGADYTVQVFSTQEEERWPEVTCKNGTLRVSNKKARAKINVVGINDRTYVVIGVPRRAISELTVNAEASSGNIEIQGFTADAVTAETSSGNITLDNFAAKTIFAKASSGAIGFEEVRAADISCETSSGNIKAEDVTADSFTATASSGTVKIEESRITECFSQASSGNVKIEESAIGFVTATTSSGDITMDGRFDGVRAEAHSGAVHLENASALTKDSFFKCTSGNVRIGFADNSGFTLKYKTNSGTVRNGFTDFSGRKSGNDVYKNGSVLITAETSSGNITLVRNR